MGSWLKSAKFIWTLIGTVTMVVASYDSYSSQFDLPNISSIWGASHQLLPPWGWIALIQLMPIGWLAYRVRKQSGLYGPVAPVETTKGFERLEKRLVTAQDQLSLLLAWKDKIDADEDSMPGLRHEIASLSKIVDDLSISLTETDTRSQYNYQIINNAYGEITRLQAQMSQYEHRARSIIRASIPINVKECLSNINERLNHLSKSVYGGEFTDRLDTNFQPSPVDEVEFDALCQVAADIVAIVPGMLNILNIPADPGSWLFIPRDEGYLAHTGDGPERARGYAASRRRYVHFKITEFLRVGHGQ